MANYIALGLLIVIIAFLLSIKQHYRPRENYMEEVAINIYRTEVPRDGIKRIDEPIFLPAQNIEDVDVFTVVYKGASFAFPVSTMIYHEIVNFTVGKEKVAFTYCPLTGTPRFFVGYHFGITGKLYNMNLVMYELNSGSQIPQIVGRAVDGKMKNTAIKTAQVNHLLLTEWKKKYPKTKVLSLGKEFRKHKVNIYGLYDWIIRLWYPLKAKSSLLPAKEIMQCFTWKNKHYAVSLRSLKKKTFTGGNANISIEKTPFGVVAKADAKQIDSFETFWFAWYGHYQDTIVVR